ncbi:hypothetical protein KAR91_73575 [Candidatus Pacearchaeota archaeon]|nr:hypothetical protein [Candidatus Pacearchaeota archaeon]
MTQLVLIADGTKRDDNEIGDLVDYYSDGTINPKDSGYSNFAVIQTKTTIEEIDKIQNEIVEANPVVFEKLNDEPSYILNFAFLTEQDIGKLKDEKTDSSINDSILRNKAQSCAVKRSDKIDTILEVIK